MDFTPPDDILEDAYDKFGNPMNVRDELRCDEGEHTKVRAYVESSDGGLMATFACEDCGENLVASKGNWVSQEDWDEEDWEEAQDWDRLRNKFNYLVEKNEENRKECIREYCKKRVNTRRDNFSLPAQDASPKVWHDLLTSLRDENLKSKAYDAYLDSDWWNNRRERVLEEKGNICMLQYPGCTGRAKHIHHKTYELIGFEPLHHLEPACKNCHDKLHLVRDGRVPA